MSRSSLALICLLFGPDFTPGTNAATVRLKVFEESNSKPVPCRVHCYDAKDQPVRPDGHPFWRDHFVCDGTARLELPAGDYRYEVERGPEYHTASGRFTVDAGEREFQVEVQLRRIVRLAGEGWWPGDLHVHRPAADIEALMLAEDLHVAPVITWWNRRNPWTEANVPEPLRIRFDSNRYYHLMAGEDEREGGALLYFHLDRPLPIQEAAREVPSPMVFLNQARDQHGDRVWVDIEKPFWWDVPTWLASGQTDSIGLANNHMCRSQMLANEAWGRPRDAGRLPDPRGNGFWTQEIYYHILDAGLRLPPSAGSASGVLPNPVGYNRVYVLLDPGAPLDYGAWWRGLKAGRSFVSNGPLLRVQANGHPPGHVFSADFGGAVNLRLTARIDSRDPFEFVEIMKDGRVERRVPRAEWSAEGSLGELRFASSGWFLVRVIAEVPHTFRFASTAPFYVEVGAGHRRISRKSARFFLDWVRERIGRVDANVQDPAEREQVVRHHQHAERFWQRRLEEANAE